jgi:enterochelin esterase family protein
MEVMMIRRIASLGLAVALIAAAAAAQPPAAPPAGGGRGGRGPAVVSPEVGADRTVTLRYLAPNATQVTANGELDGKPHPMTKGADGVWSVTIGPLDPDIYTYAFTVDGVVALDPRNVNTKYGYGNFGAVSIVEVPGDGPQFYDTRAVPHGEVRIRPYSSKTLGLTRTVWVYTPPNYEKGGNFPVMYLLHGAGDIESGWTLIGRANNILDNLIAEGKAKPMVVVMPLGHAIQSFWTGPAKSAAATPGAAPGQPPAPGPAALSPFAKDLLDDVMPMIESTYKVSKKADDRAIAGLSMGGGQTMNIAFNRPELFRYVVMMSPAAPRTPEQAYPAAFKDPSTLNKQFKLFWMAVGKDDTLTGPGDRDLTKAFEQAGIKHQFKLTDGRHEWTVWRHHLQEVAPLLFK